MSILEKPKISGYCVVLNCETYRIPYLESIKNHLEFCDEVIVVDGGSTDGTWEKILTLSLSIPISGKNSKLRVVQRTWDYSQPDMMGQQKSFARSLCNFEYCWQFDTDEFLPEWQYDAVQRLIRNYPTVELFDLPAITFYGNMVSVAAQENHFKWRLSKNLSHIKHGVHIQARQYDESRKMFFAREQSDSCEYIHEVTGEIIGRFPPINQELWKLNLQYMDKRVPHILWGQYSKLIAELLNGTDLPCVYHYAWVDYERKAEMARFWSKMKRHYENGGAGTKEGTWIEKSTEDITKEDIRELALSYYQKPTFFVNIKAHPSHVLDFALKNKWSFVEKFTQEAPL